MVHKRRRSANEAHVRKKGRWVMGRNVVNELLCHAPHVILEAYVAQHDCEHGGSLASLRQNLFELNVTVTVLPRERLTELVGSASHQGIVVLAHEKPVIALKEFLAARAQAPRSLIVVVDGVQDPQNLGAIIRAAECFGADGVIWSYNRTPDVTPVVAKASAGASELLPCIIVANLVTAVEMLKKADYWVVAAMLGDDAESIEQFNFPARLAVVVGSEGLGVRSLLARKADFKLSIPMRGKISSLNVSQAAAILLHAACARR